jgi:S1-C subfamily serine protease
MKPIKKKLKILGISLVFLTTNGIVSYAVDPGSVEAINSASKQCRNIIGIEISTATEDQRIAVGCDEKGVLVSAVIPKHPAEFAGLRVGDIIITIDGAPVTDVSEALMAMNGLDAGRKYPFEVCRPGILGKHQKLTLYVLIEKVQEKKIGKIS